FLHISKRLARTRPSSAACRHRDGSAWLWLRAPQRTLTVCLSLSACNGGKCSSTSTAWPMDSGLWNVDRSGGGVGCVFQCRWCDSHHLGNVGRHLGNDRTWCMVHRCASVRPEAFRDVRALDLAFHPLKEVALVPQKAVSVDRINAVLQPSIC